MGPIRQRSQWLTLPAPTTPGRAVRRISCRRRREGGRAQGIASNPNPFLDKLSNLVLQLDGALKMFNPQVNDNGEAVSAGDGGTVPDTSVVDWIITNVA